MSTSTVTPDLAVDMVVCPDPTCDADNGVHFTDRIEPDTGAAVEAGPCPFWPVSR